MSEQVSEWVGEREGGREKERDWMLKLSAPQGNGRW